MINGREGANGCQRRIIALRFAFQIQNSNKRNIKRDRAERMAPSNPLSGAWNGRRRGRWRSGIVVMVVVVVMVMFMDVAVFVDDHSRGNFVRTWSVFGAGRTLAAASPHLQRLAL